jgi:hypothetical protein
LGNHEFYGQKIPKLTSEIKQLAQNTNVHVLKRTLLKLVTSCFWVRRYGQTFV